jgi:hypothetical protein
MTKITPKLEHARIQGNILKYDNKIITDTKKLLSKLKEDGYIWSKEKSQWVQSSGEIFIMITATDEHIDALAEKVIDTLITEYEYGNISLSNPEYKPTPAKEKDRETVKEGFSSVYLYFQNLEN